ncbi:MAG: hypothetical protein R8K49_04100 [Mariprofundaceae bacterium]
MFHRIVIFLCILSFNGCALLNKPDAGQAPKAQHSANGKKHTAPSKPIVIMIPEFGDIPVPAELSRDSDRSFIYEAPGVTMGVITYTGYYKGGSIAKFFRNEMPKQEWQFLNAFSEGSTYLLSFIKIDKSCMISVEETSLSTRVTIKVGPTQGR